jgi:hypothetical protein
MTDGALQFGAH